MSEISGTPRRIPPSERQKTSDIGKAQSDVKGTSDSSETQAASQFQNADALKGGLISIFGDKVGQTAFDILSAEAKKGKDLSFDVVKQAVLTASKKEKEKISQAQIDALRSAFPEEPEITGPPSKPRDIPEDDWNPNQYMHDLNQIRKQANKAISRMKEAVQLEETKQELTKLQEIKEKQTEEGLRITGLRGTPEKRV